MLERKSRTIEYGEGDHVVKLVIVEATAMTAMKRAIYGGRAQAFIDKLQSDENEEGNDSEVDSVALSAAAILARIAYPDCLAATKEISGLPQDMPIEDFLDLPQELTDAWQNVVYELNPHWYPFQEKDEGQDEKKEADDSGKSNSDANSSSTMPQ